jgi:membrane protein implicated in regulation of membrane protease activity
VGDPELWRWIWLAAAAVFLVGEMASAGTFFMLPFAIGAIGAAALAFAGVGLPAEWIAFVVLSAGSAAALRPLARRFTAGDPTDGIGARRWIGEHAKVLTAIPAGRNETGLVRVGRQEWRAESLDGSPVATDTVVRVVNVVGTRLVVWPVDEAGPGLSAAPTDPGAPDPPDS